MGSSIFESFQGSGSGSSRECVVGSICLARPSIAREGYKCVVPARAHGT